MIGFHRTGGPRNTEREDLMRYELREAFPDLDLQAGDVVEVDEHGGLVRRWLTAEETTHLLVNHRPHLRRDVEPRQYVNQQVVPD